MEDNEAFERADLHLVLTSHPPLIKAVSATVGNSLSRYVVAFSSSYAVISRREEASRELVKIMGSSCLN